MQNKRNIFLTGAPGLLGTYLLKLFLQGGHTVFVSARSKKEKNARERVIDALRFWDKETLNKHSHNLRVVEADITTEGLGLEERTKDLLLNRVEEIFHSAAVVDFNWPLDKIRRVNVEGTRNVLDFALKGKNLKKVNHISTAYVCGDYKGRFSEDDLDMGQRFNTTYEQTKFEAEKLVEEYRKKNLWIDIFRPPIVIGEFSTGRITKFRQAFYQMVYLWQKEIFDHFPGNDFSFYMVPLDELCKSIYNISSWAGLKNKNYHPFLSQPLPLRELLNLSHKLLGFKKPKLIRDGEFSKINFTPTQKILLKNNILAINGKARLNSQTTNEFLNKYGFKFSELNKNSYLKMLEYAVRTGFLRNKKYGRK